MSTFFFLILFPIVFSHSTQFSWCVQGAPMERWLQGQYEGEAAGQRTREGDREGAREGAKQASEIDGHRYGWRSSTTRLWRGFGRVSSGSRCLSLRHLPKQGAAM